jgi:hypothetical protein
VSATTTLTVVPAHVPVGSLSLAGAGAPALSYAGGTPVVVTYTVRNNGELPMPGVRLTTAFPAGVSATGPTCRADAACDLGTLQPGQLRTVRFTVVATKSVDARITAKLTTTGPDANAADNTSTVRLRVLLPELVIDPTTGPPGLVVHAAGRGFPPGARLTLAWSTGTSQPGVVSVGRDGTFSAQALVFTHDPEAVRTLVATRVAGIAFGPVESNSFLLARPGLQPPFDRDN